MVHCSPNRFKVKQIDTALQPRQLRAHVTPRNKSLVRAHPLYTIRAKISKVSRKLATVPPEYRPKSEGCRPKMDRKVESDIKDFRWKLSKSETRGLLEALFPPSLLFGSQLGMEDVLNDLRDNKLYGMTSGMTGESWIDYPKLQGKEAEAGAAAFLNNILERVEAFTGKKTRGLVEVF